MGAFACQKWDSYHYVTPSLLTPVKQAGLNRKLQANYLLMTEDRGYLQISQIAADWVGGSYPQIAQIDADWVGRGTLVDQGIADGYGFLRGDGGTTEDTEDTEDTEGIVQI